MTWEPSIQQDWVNSENVHSIFYKKLNKWKLNKKLKSVNSPLAFEQTRGVITPLLWLENAFKVVEKSSVHA